MQEYFTFSSSDLRYISISHFRKHLKAKVQQKFKAGLQRDQGIVKFFNNKQMP